MIRTELPGLNRRYSHPHPAQLCYTCRYGTGFDLINPAKFGICLQQGGRSLPAKRSCTAYACQAGGSWHD